MILLILFLSASVEKNTFFFKNIILRLVFKNQNECNFNNTFIYLGSFYFQ